MRERAIGIGALGFHALLQQKGVPFESALAVSLNNQIFSRYDKFLKKANKELAKERGECLDGEGYGVRFSHTTSIAPNASSSIIMGNTSPSIEPFRGNAYRQDTLSGSFLNKNKYLDRLLKTKNLTQKEYDGAWHSIISSAGSVQQLDILSDYEKDIYKTFSELDQVWVVQHAADRQKFIDQAQSVNLAFKANAGVDYLHHVHYKAWKEGLKTLYYCRSDKLYHGESMNKKVERVKFEFDKTTEETCLACEG
jgi:ribonucleoside-diphosphate reductase alpha chain